jgi:lysophospholipase L1-like esterase
MGRKVSLNLGALLFGLLVSLIFLEVALRIYHPIVQTVKGDSVVLRVNYDEVRYNTDIPGLSESHIHQNSVGFRGADPPADLADRLSIITVGGSTTRSAAQSDIRNWTALLGEAVAECFHPTWINNAGFDGHTSYTHIDLIQNYIVPFHPKVVLLLIGANELYAGNREQVRKNPARAAGIKGFIKRLEDRSEVIDLAMTLYRSYRAWNVRLSRPVLLEGDPMPPDGDARLAIARDQQPAYAERLRLIIRLLRDNQITPVLITQPTLAGRGRDPTTGRDVSLLLLGEFLYEALEIFNSTMRQVAKSEKVYLIDLAGLMPKDSQYYFDLLHYTDAGARKIAELLASRFLPFLQHNYSSYNKIACRIRE